MTLEFDISQINLIFKIKREALFLASR